MSSNFKYSVNYSEEDGAKRVRLWFINEYVRRILDKEYPDLYSDAEAEYTKFVKTLPAEDQKILNLSLDHTER